MKVRVAIFFFIFQITHLHAQDIKFNIRYHGVDNGLRSGNVRKIAQDTYGYMWIATQDGLFRYDSKNFIAYNTQFDKSRRIGASDVRNIQVEPDSNMVWLCSSYGGVDGIDIRSGNVVRHLSQSTHPELQGVLIKTFFVSGNIVFLGSDKGFFTLNRGGYDLAPILLPGLLPDETYIDLIQEVAKGKLLVLCRNAGAFIYDIASNTIIQKEPVRKPPSIGSPLQFYNCTINSKGVILVTSSYGPVLYAFRDAKLIPEPGNALNKVLKSSEHLIRRAIFDKNDQLWLASVGGLFVYRQDTLMHVKSNDERNLNNDWLNSVYAMHVDMDNNLWIGCQNGLAYLKNSVPAFIGHSYSDATGVRINHSYYLFPLNDSIVYSAAEDGLYRVNRKRYTIDVVDKGRPYDFLFKDPRGRLVVSNTQGLFILENEKKIPISSVYPRFKEYSRVRINSAIRINDSCLAMGTENSNGVLIWNHRTNGLEQYTATGNDTTLLEDIVNNLFYIRQDEFLILSDASLSLFNYRTKKVKQLLINISKDQTLANIFFDACRFRDTLFVACYGLGVFKLNSKFDMVGKINTSDGLTNDGVYKLLPWRDSLLFITTNNGLNVYSPANGAIRSFYKDDGLQDNAFEETSGNVWGDHVFVGGTNGFTSVYPDRLPYNSRPPILYINNISTEMRGGGRYEIADMFFSDYTVPRDASQTTVSFPGINYINPGRTVFKYKINDLGWVSLGNQNFISVINNWSYGTYRISVCAFNEDGVASQVKEIRLKFPPEFYETNIFKLLIVLLIIAITYGIYRVRIYQLKKEHSIRTKLASDLHDDLGSTMNSVKVYANLAMIDKSDKHLIKIRESVQEAITGIRDIIWVLDASKDDVEHLFSRVNIFARPLCEANGIVYQQEIDDEVRYRKLSQAERRNLYMMLKEAVNNAIKYSEAKKIRIAAKSWKKQLAIFVTDDGKGFDVSKSSEGNGLQNMQRRTREIRYSFRIESGASGGTGIYFEKK